MWQPDEELLHTALEAIGAEARALQEPSPDRVAEATSLLEALGTTVALNREDEGRRRVPTTLVETLREVLRSLELHDLDDAAMVVLDLAPRCLTLDPEDFEAALQPLLDALRTRDRIEFLWLGAECLQLGKAFSDDAVASRMAFDETIAPQLWQLVPLGTLRATELEWMAPTQRARFWWRARGAELGPNALHDPKRFEQVTRIFPEARPHFDAFLATMPRPRQQAEVIDLRALLARKASAHARDEHGRVRAAAAGGAHGAHEIPLVSTASVEVWLRSGTLLVDVIADLAPGARPALVCGSHRREFDPVPDTNQRFSITPSAIELDSVDARILVPLVDRTEVVPLDDVAR